MPKTPITKHFSPFPELTTFKVQWGQQITEQNFDTLELYCGRNDKIFVIPRCSEYGSDEPNESIGYYSAPAFIGSKNQIERINQFFKTKNYPLESYFTPYLPTGEILIKGFRGFSNSNEVIQLETILDDVLAILLSGDENKGE